jgi:hypothetical protein
LVDSFAKEKITNKRDNKPFKKKATTKGQQTLQEESNSKRTANPSANGTANPSTENGTANPFSKWDRKPRKCRQQERGDATGPSTLSGSLKEGP